MFEELKEAWPAVILALVTTGLLLIIFFIPSPDRAVKEHQMPNGVICYTFNTSTDCLQVER